MIKEYGKIHENLASAYARQILLGLVKLGKHGNLKIENIKIRKNGTICISDAGIVYKDTKFTCDLYNLGCIVVQMVTGSTTYSKNHLVESKLLLDFIGKCWIKKDTEKWDADQLLNHPWITSYNRKFNKVSWDIEQDKVIKRAGSVDLSRDLIVDKGSKSLDLDRNTLEFKFKKRSVCQIS